MAHYAELSEDNAVIRVIVISDDISDGEELDSASQFCAETFGGRWVQTSYNKSFRKNFAQPGMIFYPENNVFVDPSPKPWYVLNESGDWISPLGIHPDTGEELEDWQWRWLETVFALAIDWSRSEWAANVG
jgi:hypothetical protein